MKLKSNTKKSSADIIIAVPKGRLLKQVLSHFEKKGIVFSYNSRSLITHNKTHNIKILFVKNVDLPEYVLAGIAHIGIVGSDILYEHDASFLSLGEFTFGKTDICLISQKDQPPIDSLNRTRVASKYVQYTHNFLQERGLQAQIIPLQGSVEIAPLLGLAPYIVDLVETGNTIKENGLIIAEKLGKTSVQCIANKALYKFNYQAIDLLIRKLNI